MRDKRASETAEQTDREKERHVDGTILREEQPSLTEDDERREDEEKSVHRERETEARLLSTRTREYSIVRLRGIDCSLRGKSTGNDEE